jgi:hypothetical protein
MYLVVALLFAKYGRDLTHKKLPNLVSEKYSLLIKGNETSI